MHVRKPALAIVLAIIAAAGAAEIASAEGGHAVSDDLSLLPEAVRQKREQLLAIAGTGDIGALAPVLAGDGTVVSFGAPDDPIAYLVDESADGEGIETLAILADLLSAPYAVLDGGDGRPLYVWPYLAAFESLEELTPDQLVDTYRIMNPAEFEEMRALDAWYFWRVHIGPEGQLLAFVAGD